jgi:hypothetical protein
MQILAPSSGKNRRNEVSYVWNFPRQENVSGLPSRGIWTNALASIAVKLNAEEIARLGEPCVPHHMVG